MNVAETETKPDPAAALVAIAGVRRYWLPADRTLLRTAAHDRDRGHRFVVSRFPDGLDGPPQLLWRINGGGFAVVSGIAPTSGAGTTLPTLHLGNRLSIAVTLEAVQRRYSTPEIDPRVVDTLVRFDRTPPRIPRGGHRVRVLDEELPGWITATLTKAGLEPAAITGIKRIRAIRRDAPMHLVEVTAAVTVTDATAANVAVATGIGRGRAFGAGLVEVTDVH